MGRKRLFELVEQIADGEPKPTTKTEFIQPGARLSRLLNRPHDTNTILTGGDPLAGWAY
ncbi:hypothetical protein AB0E69_33450 [Kribbella sp. NPDC026611]|uniref:hypothetical protein n=1 Tax=Kribbella sp. NPDC026611 TaxID=3154911 RepID=UPI0033FA562D